MLNVVTVKFGDKYTSKQINRIYEMAGKNISLPFSFYCLTEDANGLHPDIIHTPLDLSLEFERYWWKMCLFNKNIWEDNRPTLYVDIDTVIQNNITHYFEKVNPHKITIIEVGEGHVPDSEFWPRRMSYVNSSVMLFNCHEHHDIWEDFMTDPDYNIVDYFGVCRFLTKYYPDRFNMLLPIKDYYSFCSVPNNVLPGEYYKYLIKFKRQHWFHVKSAAFGILNGLSNGGYKLSDFDEYFRGLNYYK